MLDTSGSMLGETATKVSKWDAVKLALESFLTDSQSAGLGPVTCGAFEAAPNGASVGIALGCEAIVK